jgi:sensor c-di-GMP phosphodiesterase-like protein
MHFFLNNQIFIDPRSLSNIIIPNEVWLAGIYDSLGKCSVTSNVTHHIISMAKSLDLQLVAEGVELQSQYDYLMKSNVDFIQGYFFSKPLSRDEFIQFLNITR